MPDSRRIVNASNVVFDETHLACNLKSSYDNLLCSSTDEEFTFEDDTSEEDSRHDGTTGIGTSGKDGAVAMPDQHSKRTRDVAMANTDTDSITNRYDLRKLPRLAYFHTEQARGEGSTGISPEPQSYTEAINQPGFGSR